jgi:flagellar hook-basal body complex protein FliE
MQLSIGRSKFDEYLTALKELNDAQNEAKEYGALLPLNSEEKVKDLPLAGKRAYQRLIKASEVYAKKYKAWKESMKAYGL